MKTAFLVALLCALSAAQTNNFRTLRSDIQAPVGALYRTSFQTENGITVEEEGSEGPEGVAVIRGSYSYTSPEGEVITISYVADEFGFRAEGPSVPVWPEHALEQVRRAQLAASKRK